MGLGAAGIGSLAASAIGAGGSILGSIMGGNKAASAAKQAAAAQAAALQQGVDFQKGVYADTKTNEEPFIGTGTNALYSLASLFGLPGGPNGQGGGAQAAYDAFTKLPSYTFPLEQANKAVNRSLAARGLGLSGAGLYETGQLNSGFASQQFGNYINQLASLAGLGQNAVSTLGGQGNQASGLLGQLYGQIGGANASGIVGANNAQNNTLSQILGLLGSNKNNWGPNSMAGQIGSGVGNALGSAWNYLSNAFSGGNTTPTTIPSGNAP